MGYGFAGCAAPRRTRGPRDSSVFGQPDPSRRASRGHARTSRRLGGYADTISGANTGNLNSNGDDHSYGYTFAVCDSHTDTLTHPVADGNAHTITHAFTNSDGYADTLAHPLTVRDGQSYGYCLTIRDAYAIALTDRDSHKHAIGDGQTDVNAVTAHDSHASAITHVFADGNLHPAAVTHTASPRNAGHSLG